LIALLFILVFAVTLLKDEFTVIVVPLCSSSIIDLAEAVAGNGAFIK
jgi:hypothetical protein